MAHLSRINGDGASNYFTVQLRDSITYTYINTESFAPGLDSGAYVLSGQQIGLTGETWDGGKNQHTGPHLHTEFGYKGTKFNAFPMLIEAYFRDYTDEVVAIAGGYGFASVREVVQLYGTCSLARPGEEIVAYYWITHKGDTINEPIFSLAYDAPGLYSEQLIVLSKLGAIDRDFLQVKVNHEELGNEIVARHVMYHHVRNIQPVAAVLFWNRLVNIEGPVRVDFGDGSQIVEIEEEVYHRYNRSGNYVVTYEANGKLGDHAVVQMEVKVE